MTELVQETKENTSTTVSHADKLMRPTSPKQRGWGSIGQHRVKSDMMYFVLFFFKEHESKKRVQHHSPGVQRFSLPTSRRNATSRRAEHGEDLRPRRCGMAEAQLPSVAREPHACHGL